MSMIINHKYRFDCPFCLGADSAKLVNKSYRRHGIERFGYYVGCKKCFARGPLFTIAADDVSPTSVAAIVKEASEKWESVWESMYD